MAKNNYVNADYIEKVEHYIYNNLDIFDLYDVSETDPATYEARVKEIIKEGEEYVILSDYDFPYLMATNTGRIINLEKLTQYSVRFSVNSFLLYVEQRKIDLQAIFESQGWKWDLKEVYNRYKTKKWKHTVYLNNGVNPLED